MRGDEDCCVANGRQKGLLHSQKSLRAQEHKSMLCSNNMLCRYTNTRYFSLSQTTAVGLSKHNTCFDHPASKPPMIGCLFFAVAIAHCFRTCAKHMRFVLDPTDLVRNSSNSIVAASTRQVQIVVFAQSNIEVCSVTFKQSVVAYKTRCATS